eukprot:351017-Chlamydomonas_euryale.AAC.12
MCTSKPRTPGPVCGASVATVSGARTPRPKTTRPAADDTPARAAKAAIKYLTEQSTAAGGSAAARIAARASADPLERRRDGLTWRPARPGQPIQAVQELAPARMPSLVQPGWPPHPGHAPFILP